MNTRRLLWWLLAGTRGGSNRARILMALRELPSNANQLSELLELDYKTIRHHLGVLVEHEIVVKQGNGYGTVYFLSTLMDENFENFKEIWVQIGKRRKREEQRRAEL